MKWIGFGQNRDIQFCCTPAAGIVCSGKALRSHISGTASLLLQQGHRTLGVFTIWSTLLSDRIPFASAHQLYTHETCHKKQEF